MCVYVCLILKKRLSANLVFPPLFLFHLGKSIRPLKCDIVPDSGPFSFRPGEHYYCVCFSFINFFFNQHKRQEKLPFRKAHTVLSCQIRFTFVYAGKWGTVSCVYIFLFFFRHAYETPFVSEYNCKPFE